MAISSSKPIVVEFNGLPGSGKTTIARILQEKLKQAGIPTISRYARHRFLNNVYSIWLSPKYIKSLYTVNSSLIL